MTDIDTQADIELHSGDGHVTVSVPLAGAVTGEWLRCYQQLALATKLPAATRLSAASFAGVPAATADERKRLARRRNRRQLQHLRDLRAHHHVHRQGRSARDGHRQ